MFVLEWRVRARTIATSLLVTVVSARPDKSPIQWRRATMMLCFHVGPLVVRHPAQYFLAEVTAASALETSRQ